MKRIFALFTFFIFSHILIAQDLIVTTNGESLDCKIEKVDEDKIYFTYYYLGQLKDSSIPRELVKKYKTNSLKTNQGIGYPNVNNELTYPIVRFAVNAGPSYRTGSIPKGFSDEVVQYIRKVKTGNHWGGDFNCLISETIGFGLKYNRFRSTDQAENISLPDPEGNILTGKIEEDVTISYIGPTIATSFFLEPAQSLFIANFSLGMLQYKNKASFIDSYLLSGNNLGFSFDIGFDKSLTKNLACGIKLAFVGGYLSQLEMQKGTEKENLHLPEGYYEDLSHLNLSFGLRFK